MANILHSSILRIRFSKGETSHPQSQLTPTLIRSCLFQSCLSPFLLLTRNANRSSGVDVKARCRLSTLVRVRNAAKRTPPAATWSRIPGPARQENPSTTTIKSTRNARSSIGVAVMVSSPSTHSRIASTLAAFKKLKLLWKTSWTVSKVFGKMCSVNRCTVTRFLPTVPHIFFQIEFRRRFQNSWNFNRNNFLWAPSCATPNVTVV